MISHISLQPAIEIPKTPHAVVNILIWIPHISSYVKHQQKRQNLSPETVKPSDT
jgi:hypothetical protein